MVIVVVLPLPKFVVQQVNIVADAIGVEQLIKLLIIDAVRALDLSVQMRGAGPDVDVSLFCSRCQWQSDWNSAPLSVCTT
jgi:hypothetical protein